MNDTPMTPAPAGGTPVGVGQHEWEQRSTQRTGAGTVFDPFPRFAELRREAAVHPHSFFALFGVDDPFAAVWGDTPRFSTFTYSATEQVLRDAKRFSSARIQPMVERQFGKVSLMASDDPEHRRYRALVQPAFSRRGLSMWQRWLEPRLDELIDRFEAAGRANLYFEYCAGFPVYITAMALGVDTADLDRFHEWAATLQIGAATPEEADAAVQHVREYMLDVIADRREAAQEDLISLLVNSEIDDEDGRHELTDEQILGFVRNILPAGAGTTYRTLGILLVALLERPTLMDELYTERELVPKVVEEILRWNGPVSFMFRVAIDDTEIDGTPVPAGALIEAGMAPANRDPSRWDDPDVFDPRRPSRSNLGFSIGPHFCVGMQVARMELEVALNRLLDRLPRLRLDPDAEPPTTTGLLYRMPTGVPAVWG